LLNSNIQQLLLKYKKDDDALRLIDDLNRSQSVKKTLGSSLLICTTELLDLSRELNTRYQTLQEALGLSDHCNVGHVIAHNFKHAFGRTSTTQAIINVYPLDGEVDYLQIASDLKLVQRNM